MDSTIVRLNAINELRDKLEELNSPTGFQGIGESQFQKWDLFHRNSALIIKRLFGENSQYLRDWLKIEIPEDPDIEDDKGFSTYSHKQGIAEDKMENQLEIMAKEIVTSKTNENNKLIRKQKSDNERVFIVHGTDYEPVKELKAILQEVEIKPIILHEQPSKGMTIIEKLETYSNVGFAFIILTPDDLGLSKKELAKIVSEMSREKPTQDELKKYLSRLSLGQRTEIFAEAFNHCKDKARQNVVLEFGYFIGKIGRSKVCCLYKGDLELPSDMHGICYLHFNGSVNEVKETIFNELKASGFDLKPKLLVKCRNCGAPLEASMDGCPKCGSKDRDIAVFDHSRGEDSLL
jgi:predicted nucleotide-binding protein